MSENSPCGELLALTTEIASAYIGNNVVEAGVTDNRYSEGTPR